MSVQQCSLRQRRWAEVSFPLLLLTAFCTLQLGLAPCVTLSWFSLSLSVPFCHFLVDGIQVLEFLISIDM